MICDRCELLTVDVGDVVCSLCRAELAGVHLVRCGPVELGRFLRVIFMRKRGGLGVRPTRT